MKDRIYLRVNIDDDFKPLDIDNLRHEIENLVGVIEVYPCVEFESAKKPCAVCGRVDDNHLNDEKHEATVADKE
jgi:hypothetical protein